MNRGGEIFRRGDDRFKVAHVFVQIAMVHVIEHATADHGVERRGITHAAGRFIERSDGRYFENIVVAMTIGIVAFAVERGVFGVGQAAGNAADARPRNGTGA